MCLRREKGRDCGGLCSKPCLYLLLILLLVERKSELLYLIRRFCHLDDEEVSADGDDAGEAVCEPQGGQEV